jgi:hypothetical protein
MDFARAQPILRAVQTLEHGSFRRLEVARL